MKYVVDQNFLRSKDLEEYMSQSINNEVVITDMAIFEMLKGTDPISTAKRSLKILCKFSQQVFFTKGSGQLMREELIDKKPVEDPIHYAITEQMRYLLRDINDFQNGTRGDFPMEEARVIEGRATAMSERLEHELHAQIFKDAVNVLRTQIDPKLRKDIRKGRLTPELYKFAYQTAFLGFKNAVNDYNLGQDELTKMYLEYCFTARFNILFQLASMLWLKSGGLDSMRSNCITNDLHDIDYVLHSLYFDGILSKESRVNELRKLASEFFEIKVV